MMLKAGYERRLYKYAWANDFYSMCKCKPCRKTR